MSDFRTRSSNGKRFDTLVDILRMRADHEPDTVAYTSLGEERSDIREVTYGTLDSQARAIAACLQASRIPAGARVLLLYSPGLEYIAALIGCLYAGVVAVPAYPPRLNRPVERLKVIARDSGATAALTNSRILSRLERRFENSPELWKLRWFATDAMAEGTGEWYPPQIGGRSLAFLQYTSGSTAEPKGVNVSHANLLHNSEAIYRGLGHTPESHMVSWLPPYHDMGLIGVIIQALYGGFRVTLLQPGAFLQRPMRWLEVISETGADSAGGPNFAYDLCARRITAEERERLDLSAWQVAFCGAEPIRTETLSKFSAAFESCGFRSNAFYPGYGLAEGTLIVSGGQRMSGSVSLTVDASELELGRVKVPGKGDAGGDGAAPVRTIVGCGRSISDQRIAIVDPETCCERPVATVGEIWVSGESVAGGYWGRPEESERVFDARISDTLEGSFLRTGDLGFLWDGELFVTGRLKDLVILRGRNHYPQDLEYTVEQSHEALRAGACAAFTIEKEGETRLVIAAELERRFVRADNLDEIVSRVRGAVATEHEIEVHTIALVRTGGVPLTSSGKIRRRDTRAMYLGDELKVVRVDELPARVEALSIVSLNTSEKAIEKTPDSLNSGMSGESAAIPVDDRREALISAVQDFVMRRGFTKSVDPRTSIRRDLGLDSLAVAELAVELEEVFDVSLGEDLLGDIDSVEDMLVLISSSPGRTNESEGTQYRTGLSDFRERIAREIPQVGVVVEEQRGRSVKVGGRWCVDFASANYLGLDLHPEVISAIPRALKEWGVHPSWTRAVASPKIYEDLESELASFIGAASVLVFPTITLLHAGVLPILARGDGVILLDQASHNSLQEAAQLARSRGTLVDWFDHNDPRALEKQLIHYGRYPNKIVAVDGVYSMSGSYAPLRDFLRLTRQYEARLYIDDAHGFGVVGEQPGSRNPYGRRGNGIVRYYDLDYGDDIIYVGGMSKAFSSMVAFVTCRDSAEKARLSASSTAVFSGPTPVASLASAIAGLEISDAREGEELREGLLHMTRTLINGARELGFRVENDTSFPLVTVEIGSTSEVVRACNILWEYGILLTPALFPAVPIDRGGLRFTITSANTAEQVAIALEGLTRVAHERDRTMNA